MKAAPQVLLVDDGELELARGILDDLEADYLAIEASKYDRTTPQPERLLITTGPAAAEAHLQRLRKREKGKGPLWYAFVRGSSKTQRQELRRAGFDMLIPENVHPAALQLMLRRAVFEGENTQRGLRLAIGREIQFATALRTHRAMLVELSPRGCRVFTDRRVKPHTRIQIRIPHRDDDAEALPLRGSVRWTRPAEPEGGSPRELATGIRFDALTIEERDQLRDILRSWLKGPAELPAGTAARRGPPPARERRAQQRPTRATDPTPPGLLPRAVYEEEVTAICGGATRALMGRDLSEKGMLVERSSRLKVGERVRLALHGDRREEPFLIEAHVDRDDGERGLVLRFDWMEEHAQERLRTVIDNLPKVHRLEEDTPTYTAVLAQLIPGLRNKR